MEGPFYARYGKKEKGEGGKTEPGRKGRRVMARKEVEYARKA